tara:strand:- start:7365 stop:8282 length:918 start_codon:yes stop_codon:yes gene_type:complete
MDKKYLIKRLFHLIKNESLKNIIKKLFRYLFYSLKIDLDKINFEYNDNLDNLFIRFGTDKGSIDSKKIYEFKYKNKNKFKNYYDWINRKDLKEEEFHLGLNSSKIYEEKFKNKKNDKIKILEIGVANGHSIASWQQYFKKGIIYGIDIKDKQSFFYKSKRIKYFQLDIFQKKQIISFLKKNGPFDFIIDDSLHEERAILQNFENFFPSLKNNGIYFIEDFKVLDHFKERVIKYNYENKAKYMHSNPHTIKEILGFLNKKKNFKNPFLDFNSQNKLFNLISDVEIFDAESHSAGHPFASIGIIYKK